MDWDSACKNKGLRSAVWVVAIISRALWMLSACCSCISASHTGLQFWSVTTQGMACGFSRTGTVSDKSKR